MSHACPDARTIHIIIPFYRGAHLVAPLFDSLKTCSQEIAQLQCTLILINDSPEDQELDASLTSAVEALAETVPCKLKKNTTNIGFVKSVNAAAMDAVHAGADVILLNSDTTVFPNAFREMQRVAYLDPMIGFVSPRSNNATICNFPVQPEYRGLSPQDCYEIFLKICHYLPEFHYAPTAVGFCLYIKHIILEEFGLFDDAYGKGYNEENDLIMRANRCGFRAVLANRAYVYHLGQQSFSLSETPRSAHEQRNSQLLTARYPEYEEHIATHFSGSRVLAETLMAGLIPDAYGRVDVVFDCSHFGMYYNGTSAHMYQMIKHAAATWRDEYNVYVLASKEVAEFHQFTEIPGVFVMPPEASRVFAIAFKCGQPFDFDAIIRLARIAPINVYAMLDTIAWDCLYLNRDDLDEIWRAVAVYADGLFYNSEFSRDQFRMRFAVRPGMPEKSSYLSLDPREYSTDCEANRGQSVGSYLLVVGNAFAHKYVEPTVSALSRQFPRTRIVALGLDLVSGQNVIGYTSGQLSSKEVHKLFKDAVAVVYPSTYEGFGMPIMDGLAHRKPVFARDSFLNRAMHERLGLTRNIRLYSSTKDLVSLLAAAPLEWVDDLPVKNLHSWASHTEDLRSLLRAAMRNFSFQDTLLPRLDFLRLVERAGLRKETRLALAGSAEAHDALLAHITNSGGSSPAASAAESEILAALEDHHRALIEKLNALSEGQGAFSSLNNQIKDLQLQLKDRNARIEGMLNSASWRLTAPLRAFGSLFLGARIGDQG